MDHTPTSESGETRSIVVDEKPKAEENDLDLNEDGPIDPAEEKKVVRKLDHRILPLLFILWLAAFIDRSNIGNAKIEGLVTDLNLDGVKLNTAFTVFYPPYIAVEMPSNLVLRYLHSGTYLSCLIIAWGVVSTLTGLVKSYGGLLAARIFLGICEGGFLGGVILYFSMFYKRHQTTTRIGLFYTAAPLSGAIGGLLASAFSLIKVGSYQSWPWIFFCEGIITVVVGIISAFLLPADPGTAKFLSPREQKIATRRLVIDAQGSTSKNDVFKWKWVRMAIFNWNTILMSTSFFFVITPIYSYSLFLPTIISALGYQAIHAQLLTVPPYICGALSVLICTYLSDRYKKRGIFIFGGCCVGIAGYAMLIGANPMSNPNVLTDANIKYGGTFLVSAGIFPTSPIVMGWLSNNLAPHYVRAAGTAFQLMIANCAAFLATFTYISADSPRYIVGHSINIGSLIIALILTAINIFYIKWENRKRDSGARDARFDDGTEGFRHPQFRYTV